MIIRIVRMRFRAEEVDEFQAFFSTINANIRQFPGCLHLELWQDTKDQAVFTTYSHWEAEEDLENYRHSELFKSFWSVAKPKFAEKALAWSSHQIVVAS
jgi:quinol monooxygenase YgiN